ncbi:DUF6089 family protein [Limibacter armeniacum]|uniref:DUF6089 family protein n=1 Tax=Limibacter armeniacum TaxID=466084 RepID=UPI002FE522A7
MRKLRILLLLLVGLSMAYTSYGQRYKFTRKKRYWSVGGTMNVSHYLGDVTPKSNTGSFDWDKTRPSFGGFVMKRFTPRVSGRLMLSEIIIAGDDANAKQNSENLGRYYRNLHFRNFITELSAMAVIDVFKNEGVYYRRKKIPIPYLSVGVAVFHHAPQAQDPNNGDWTNLRKLETEGESYSPISIAFPVGIGIRYKISNKMDIGVEALVRYTLTDYLDDVSGKYYNPNISEDAYQFAFRGHEKTTADGDPRDVPDFIDIYNGGNPDYSTYQEFAESQVDIRGDPDNKDVYMSFGVFLNYIFSSGVKTPKFR